MSGAPPPVVAIAVPSSTILLLFLAVVAGGFGLLNLTQATLGAGLIALGCLLGIWARIHQAQAHHRDVMRRFGSRNP